MINSVIVDDIQFDGNTLPIIAGPCVIESREHCLRMAESIAKIMYTLKLPYIFKSSYDKANRTSVKSFRGLGMEKGLKILQEVKSELENLYEVLSSIVRKLQMFCRYLHFCADRQIYS